jgi:polar amino acid transport system substrate-binding protein
MIRIIKQLLLTAITLALPIIVHSENKTITVATGEWPPFISENFKHNGVAARIIKESFASQNIHVRYDWFPWKRAYHNVRVGSWDASAIWAKTPQRSTEVLFSDPVINNNTVLFFRKDNVIEWKSYEDLSGLIIGATNGYFNGAEFAQAEKSGLITVERTSIESSNFKKLASKRLDAVIAEIDTGYYIMQQVFNAEQIASIIVSPNQVASLSTHLVISKEIENAEDLISAFNKGLKQLTKSGKVDQYLKESRNGQYQQ